MRLFLAVGTTRTAAIDGISAAGADPRAMLHTPAADAEILAYGRPVRAPRVPVSPTGCPTPALVTRAVRELKPFGLAVIDAGLAARTGAPTIGVGAAPGEDIRKPVPVPAAESVVDEAQTLAAELPDDELLIGESVPGGTTTAMGVLRALGEPAPVSSSLPENPRELKESVVGEGLAASDLDTGNAAGDPIRALRTMGDPVLASVVGVVAGAAETGTKVTLAGGTQLLAAAALARHAGVEAPLTLATTSFVDDDVGDALRCAAEQLEIAVAVTDPRFDRSDHRAMAGYVDGEAKEGVGMGGALHVASRSGVSMEAVRERVIERYRREVSSDGS